MKKTLLFILLPFNLLFAQSITLTPNTNPSGVIKTNTNSGGYEHTDGTIRLQTYLNNSSAQYLGGWIQTYTAHPLIFSTTNGLPQMYLNNNGNIILNPSDGKTGNIGIGLIKSATPAEKLEVNGNIRTSNLAGTGVRNVYTDANGTLLATPQTRTLVLTSANFVLDSQDETTYVSNPGGNASIINPGLYNNSGFVTSLNLPDGATISNITFYYTDQISTNYRFRFYKNSVADNVSYQSYIDENSSSNVGADKFISSNINVVIDAQKTYILEANVVDGNGSSGLSFKGVKITYTL